MAGAGDFLILFGSVLETRGGLGILWYTREVFRYFVLTGVVVVQPDGPNNYNSGIFLRFPALNASNPANDWKTRRRAWV